MKKIAGIDPGNSGGIAIAYENSILGAIPMPTHQVTPVKKTYTYVDCRKVYEFLKGNEVEVVYIELVGARPGQGGVSMYNFGFSTGGLHGVCAALGVEVITVRPQTWKKEIFGDGDDRDKQAAIDFCKQNFPNVSLMATKRSKVESDGIADAICIATYGLKNQLSINNRNQGA